MTLSKEEIKSRIEELEIEIEKKRSSIDIKFGPGAFDRGVGSIKPHKCSKHLDEVFYGFSIFEFIAPTRNFFKCFLVQEELPLLFPEATNSMFETTELQKMKNLLAELDSKGK